MKLENCSIEQLVKGYQYLADEKKYQCLNCPESFSEDEVYPVNGHYYKAAKAMIHHMKNAHISYRHDLIYTDSKYNTLTDHQKELMTLFASDLSDKEIAKKMNISTSTVRHQKFIFREKAKQARLYLAIYESIFSGETKQEDIVPIHDHAKMVDMRYVITEEEKQKVWDTYFKSLNPLRLREFPAREKKKVAALIKICAQFENDRKYTEKEINDVLSQIYEDVPTIRRYLIQYGFMKREKDGTLYWRT